MNWEDARRRLNEFDTDFVGTQLKESIIETEDELGQTFPPEYRSFIETFGCGSIDSEEIIGLGGPDHLSVMKPKTVFGSRIKKMPNHLISIRADGSATMTGSAANSSSRR